MKHVLIAFIAISLSFTAFAQEEELVDETLDSVVVITERVERKNVPIMRAYAKCGNTAFYKEMYSVIKYPRPAVMRKVQGTVDVKFNVNEDGSLTDFRIAKSVGEGCDEEAIRVIKEANKKCPWIPAKREDVPLKQIATLSITFKLQ